LQGIAGILFERVHQFSREMLFWTGDADERLPAVGNTKELRSGPVLPLSPGVKVTVPGCLALAARLRRTDQEAVRGCQREGCKAVLPADRAQVLLQALCTSRIDIAGRLPVACRSLLRLDAPPGISLASA